MTSGPKLGNIAANKETWFDQVEIPSHVPDLQKIVDSKFSHFLAPIVGNYYRSQIAQRIYQKLKVGDLVYLVFDPKNKFDKNAVKVLTHPKDDNGKSHHLGFVDRYNAGKMVEMVQECFYTYYTGYGMYKKFVPIDVEFVFEICKVNEFGDIKIQFKDSVIF